jgi:hypothetical protein
MNNSNDTITIEKINFFKEKYPDRIPVFVSETKNGITIDKKKYLVPNDITVGQLSLIFRNKTNLKSQEAMFLSFIDNNNKRHMFPGSIYLTTVSTTIENNGLLKVSLMKENTFG